MPAAGFLLNLQLLNEMWSPCYLNFNGGSQNSTTRPAVRTASRAHSTLTYTSLPNLYFCFIVYLGKKM